MRSVSRAPKSIYAIENLRYRKSTQFKIKTNSPHDATRKQTDLHGLTALVFQQRDLLAHSPLVHYALVKLVGVHGTPVPVAAESLLLGAPWLGAVGELLADVLRAVVVVVGHVRGEGRLGLSDVARRTLAVARSKAVPVVMLANLVEAELAARRRFVVAHLSRDVLAGLLVHLVEAHASRFAIGDFELVIALKLVEAIAS